MQNADLASEKVVPYFLLLTCCKCTHTHSTLYTCVVYCKTHIINTTFKSLLGPVTGDDVAFVFEVKDGEKDPGHNPLAAGDNFAVDKQGKR